jgi:acetolactate synthase-1/2/3 large subunit
MAIGVKLSRPNERVWSINGDGGFQMNIQELGTIMEHKIDVKMIVLNNGYLGMVRQWQTLFFDGRYSGTPMLNPNYGLIAEAYGIPYLKVENVEDIMPSLLKAIEQKGPILLEFVCDPTEVILPMIPSEGGFKDMIIARPKKEKSASKKAKKGAKP